MVQSEVSFYVNVNIGGVIWIFELFTMPLAVAHKIAQHMIRTDKSLPHIDNVLQASTC